MNYKKQLNNMSDLFKQHFEAQDMFTHYMLKMTYGDPRDLLYNFELAKEWDNTIKKIRQQINEQSR